MTPPQKGQHHYCAYVAQADVLLQGATLQDASSPGFAPDLSILMHRA